MAGIVYAVLCAPYVQYDGTNGQAILDASVANSITYPLAIQADSTAETLRISIDWSGGDPIYPQVAENYIVMEQNDYILLGGQSVIKPDVFAAQYLVIPPVPAT